MLAFLILVFIATVLLIVVVVAGMFFDSAVSGEQVMAERQAAVRTWRPPFAHGGALTDWAIVTAERIADKWLSGKRDAATPIRLAAELNQGATRAMAPFANDCELERKVPCPEIGQGMIGLTAPEVLEIADDLRKNLPRSEVKRIRKLARENSQRIAQMDHEHYAAARIPCPLAGEHRVCCAYAGRPLRCRPLHAMMIAGGDEPGMTEGAARTDSYEQTVEQAVEAGLRHALRSTGLDANLYELNGALAKALDTPDAAACWARGEGVFEECKRYR
jgi:hypothetical protein